MSEVSPVFSVIIPHLNQPEGLEKCLASLANQNISREAFEVIVVDNGSSCTVDSVVFRHSGTRLLQELTPGPGPARNCGARAARGAIFAFIDADCRADPDWVRLAEETLGRSEKGTMGGDTHHGDGARRRSTLKHMNRFWVSLKTRWNSWLFRHRKFDCQAYRFRESRTVRRNLLCRGCRVGRARAPAGFRVPLCAGTGCLPSGPQFNSGTACKMGSPHRTRVDCSSPRGRMATAVDRSGFRPTPVRADCSFSPGSEP